MRRDVGSAGLLLNRMAVDRLDALAIYQREDNRVVTGHIRRGHDNRSQITSLAYLTALT